MQSISVIRLTVGTIFVFKKENLRIKRNNFQRFYLRSNYAQVHKERVNPFSIPDEQFKVKHHFKNTTLPKIVDFLQKTITIDCRGCGTTAEVLVM